MNHNRIFKKLIQPKNKPQNNYHFYKMNKTYKIFKIIDINFHINKFLNIFQFYVLLKILNKF